MQVLPMAPSPTMTSLTGTGYFSIYIINDEIWHHMIILAPPIRAQTAKDKAKNGPLSGPASCVGPRLTIFKTACRNPWAGSRVPWAPPSCYFRLFSCFNYLSLRNLRSTMVLGLYIADFVLKSRDLPLLLTHLTLIKSTSISATSRSISSLSSWWK